jgi:hypothetical protein
MVLGKWRRCTRPRSLSGCRWKGAPRGAGSEAIADQADRARHQAPRRMQQQRVQTGELILCTLHVYIDVATHAHIDVHVGRVCAKTRGGAMMPRASGGVVGRPVSPHNTSTAARPRKHAEAEPGRNIVYCSPAAPLPSPPLHPVHPHATAAMNVIKLQKCAPPPPLLRAVPRPDADGHGAGNTRSSSRARSSGCRMPSASWTWTTRATSTRPRSSRRRSSRSTSPTTSCARP